MRETRELLDNAGVFNAERNRGPHRDRYQEHGWTLREIGGREEHGRTLREMGGREERGRTLREMEHMEVKSFPRLA